MPTTTSGRCRRVLGSALLTLLSAGCHKGHVAPEEAPPSPHAVDRANQPAQRASHTAPLADPEQPPPYFFKLVERASEMAQRSAPSEPKPPRASDVDGAVYDAYRSIRYRAERSLWREQGAAFEVQFFHPGSYYQDTVRVFELSGAVPDPRAIPFSTSLFSYGEHAPPDDDKLNFTGFRIHAAINQSDYKDEFLVFQGASYFRPLGRGNAYGLSARGLAVNLGRDPEEFPRFTEFYLGRPEPEDRFVWVLALLESRSVTGAYAFRASPDRTTVVDVIARLFPRSPGATIGLAPMSSMYLFGEDAPNRFGDFRPEVHDSDGLSLSLESGEWLYRPLRNPERTTLCAFEADRIDGFGLVQRDRAFTSYQDLEANYERRPSLWVEPIQGFGSGVIHLLEIATNKETDDNIAIAFSPHGGLTEELELQYRLHAGSAVPGPPNGAIVSGTRKMRTAEGTRFFVDFSNVADEGPTPISFDLTVPGATIIEQHLERNEHVSGYRISFEVKALNPNSDVELRAFLRQGDNTISETWSYLWQADS